MDVKIESMIFGWDERIPEVLVKFINSVTLTKDEQELRELVKVFAQSKEFNRFFAFGYGSYNPQIEMFARFKMKSSFHKTKRII